MPLLATSSPTAFFSAQMSSYWKCETSPLRIGILLFDHALHFFAFYPGLVQPSVKAWAACDTAIF